MRYRMLGIDLDGTLLDRRGRVSAENRHALQQAQRAGVLVAPCTGRGWVESRSAIAQLPMPPASAQLETRNPKPETDSPGVFVGGAAVCDLVTGRSRDLAVIEPHLALRIVHDLRDGPEAVLVFRDAQLVGHDYLVTGHGTLSPNTQWWFEATGATAHFQRDVMAEDLHHTLRVGIVAPLSRMRPVAARLRERFAGEVLIQHFEAVQMPNPEETMSVLEVFAQGVDKWRGLAWIAQRHDIAREQVAAIGDQINDVAMIRAAGCGIAMGNAIEAVKSAARHVTKPCEDAGVAYAIGELLAGRWN
jgi:5-amino-6-(5-phospho-D-ribitylamino)uracil phosphatase